MNYMGSKSKYTKYICPILQKCINQNNIDTYIQPFVGGANVIDKIKCKNRIGYDRSDTLIALLSLASEDFSKVLNYRNRELWDKGKAYVKDGIMPKDMTLADIGAIQFFGSFSHGGFPRGYANDSNDRHPFEQARRNLEKQAPLLKGVKFECKKYNEIQQTKNALIYCDIPYKMTKQYGYSKDNWTQQDYDNFWDWARKRSQNNFVFVSEQIAPEDFEPIWEKEVARTCGSDNNFKATEKLFRLKNI